MGSTRHCTGRSGRECSDSGRACASSLEGGEGEGFVFFTSYFAFFHYPASHLSSYVFVGVAPTVCFVALCSSLFHGGRDIFSLPFGPSDSFLPPFLFLYLSSAGSAPPTTAKRTPRQTVRPFLFLPLLPFSPEPVGGYHRGADVSPVLAAHSSYIETLQGASEVRYHIVKRREGRRSSRFSSSISD